MKRHLLLFTLLLLISGAMYGQIGSLYNITVQADSLQGEAYIIVDEQHFTEYTFNEGDTCWLHANPAQNYTFVNWTENGEVFSTQADTNFIVTDSMTLVANFEELPPTQYTISVQAEPEEGGEAYIIVDEQHFTEYIFNEGDTCWLHANPAQNYTFVNWTENGELFSTQADTNFIVTDSMTLVANFEELPPTQYTISVQAEPEEGGEAYIIVGEQNVTEWTFNEGDTCWLHANPALNYTFVKWTENDELFSIHADTNFIVTDSMTLVANFEELPPTVYTITVVAEPVEGGTVDGGGDYPEGTMIELSANPNTGYSFDHWDDGETLNPRTVEVTGDSTYTAIFTPIPYTITVQAEPVAGGEVIGGGTYNYGTTVTLTANAYVGYSFSQWQDGDTNSTRTFTVTGDAVYTAFFTLNQYVVEVMSNPEEGGWVIGNGIYNYGVTCTLTAIPKDGYSFSNWMDGDNVVVSSELTYSFVVTENASFTANFIRQYNINVEVTPEGAGSVTGAGTYDYGTECTLTATPSDAYFFVNWTEDGLEVSTDTTYSFIVAADRNLIANFKEIPCIEDLQEIVAKEHKEGNDTYVLVLIYPNPNNENYQYQWLYSIDDVAYTNLEEGTYNNQYYYNGGYLKDGYYKVRVSLDECSAETDSYYVSNGRLCIYPNPARSDNSIVIMNDSEGPAQLAIYSLDGRCLHMQAVNGNQATINLNLSVGVYVARITQSDGTTKVCKLIIQ